MTEFLSNSALKRVQDMLARAMAQADKILAIARLLDGVEDRLLDLQNSSRIALADANAALEILRKAHIREDEIIVSIGKMLDILNPSSAHR